MSTFAAAILLTTGAGLATAVGSVIALFLRRPGPRFMALTLGFSAGVMIHVSYVELLRGSIEKLEGVVRWEGGGFVLAHLAFFAGIVLMLLIDTLVSHSYMLEEAHSAKDDAGPAGDAPTPVSLRKAAVLVALGIAIHNFPEGMATFMATLRDVSLGTSLALAIAIHNIPEGIAVAVPVYAATGSRKQAFVWSLLSGVSEPIGALLAALVLMPFLNAVVLAWVLCVVGGFMVYISFDELLPAAHSYGQEHVVIIAVLAGMVVMAASLALF